MDLFKSFGSSGGDSEKPGSENSKSELFANAKLVAEAAQSSFNKESDKVDKAKVAGATADLLDAGQNYAKIGDKGFGQYIDHAEVYLHKYESSNSTATTPPPAAGAGAGAGAGAEEVEKPAEIPAAAAAAAEPPAEKEEETGGGYGDVLKKAGGFFK